MEYIGEIISGAFALLVVWIETRAARERKHVEKRAIIREGESLVHEAGRGKSIAFISN